MRIAKFLKTLAEAIPSAIGPYALGIVHTYYTPTHYLLAKARQFQSLELADLELAWALHQPRQFSGSS